LKNITGKKLILKKKILKILIKIIRVEIKIKNKLNIFFYLKFKLKKITQT
jgi:hypothetical protein